MLNYLFRQMISRTPSRLELVGLDPNSYDSRTKREQRLRLHVLSRVSDPGGFDPDPTLEINWIGPSRKTRSGSNLRKNLRILIRPDQMHHFIFLQ